MWSEINGYGVVYICGRERFAIFDMCVVQHNLEMVQDRHIVAMDE